jgi:aspartyl protease family protein
VTDTLPLPTRRPSRLRSWEWAWLVSGILMPLAAPAFAQSVSLSGLSAERALLVIDGGAPRFLSPGQNVNGVKLLSVGTDQVVVEVQGQRTTLRIGQGPIAMPSPEAARASRTITLLADAGGHFTTPGKINGQATQFLVDTGATVLTLSESMALKMGVNFRNGAPARVKTANGEILGHQVQLTAVTIEPHTSYNVAAVVLPADLPYVLLGNSFLSRFSMRREDNRMTLEPRY